MVQVQSKLSRSASCYRRFIISLAMYKSTEVHLHPLSCYLLAPTRGSLISTMCTGMYVCCLFYYNCHCRYLAFWIARQSRSLIARAE